jgi:spermidine synthase
VDAVVIHSLPGNTAAASDEDFLGECRRVLRPGGYIVFCADYAWWYQRIFARMRPARARTVNRRSPAAP